MYLKFYRIRIIMLAAVLMMLTAYMANAEDFDSDYIFKGFENNEDVCCTYGTEKVKIVYGEKHTGNASLRVPAEAEFGFNAKMNTGSAYSAGAYIKRADNSILGDFVLDIVSKNKTEDGYEIRKTVKGTFGGNGWVLWQNDFIYDGKGICRENGKEYDMSEDVKLLFHMSGSGKYFIDDIFLLCTNDGKSCNVSGNLKVGEKISFNIANYNCNYSYEIVTDNNGQEMVLANGITKNGEITFTIPSIAAGKKLILNYSELSGSGNIEKNMQFTTAEVQQGDAVQKIAADKRDDYYPDKDWLQEDFNYDYADEINIDENYKKWGWINLNWVEDNVENKESGVLQCNLKSYGRASPVFKVKLVKGKTYKLKARVKSSVDCATDIFNFHIKGTAQDGSESGYIMLSNQNVNLKKDQWAEIEKYFTWNGQIGETDEVSIAFRIGTGEIQKITGDDNAKEYTYYIDSFSIKQYIPKVKAKKQGDCYNDGGMTVSTTCDSIQSNDYPLRFNPFYFPSYEGAVMILKADGKVVDTAFGKKVCFKNKDAYLGKKLICEIYPVIYGKISEKRELDCGVITKRENFYGITLFDKVLNPKADAVRGSFEAEIFDGVQPAGYLAAYKNGALSEIAAASAEEAYIAKTVVREDVIEEKSEGALKWRYIANELRISGNGDIPDYESGEAAPWSNYASDARVLIIEDGISGIGDHAFENFTSLKNVIIPESTKRIGHCAFLGCTNLIAAVLNDGLEQSESDSFDENTSVCVGEGSKFAGLDGFKTYVDGEKSSEYLKHSSIAESDISWALYEDTLVICGKSMMKASVNADELPWRKYSENIVNIVIQPGITYTSIDLFSGKDADGKSIYKNWKRYTVADTVERISTGELAGGSALKYFNASNGTAQIMHFITASNFMIPIEKLTIPASVKSIGDCAFNNLNKLNELVFEEGFDAVHTGTGEWSSVFRNLSALKSVTLPKSLSRLGSYTFSRLGNLADITVLNENMEFDENCFYMIGNDVTIHGYSGSTAQKYAKKMGYSFVALNNVQLEISPNGADKLGGFLFDENQVPLTDKKTIEYDKNSLLLYVDGEQGDDAASGGYDSPYKTIERAKQEIRKITEENNDNAGKLKWHYSDNILRISGSEDMLDYESAEAAPWSRYAAEVRTLIIDDGVLGVGDHAFENFTSLKNVIIPESTKRIGHCAFSGCTNLIAAVLNDGLEQLESDSFDENTAVCVGEASGLSGYDGIRRYTDGEQSSEYLKNTSVAASDISWALYEDTLVLYGKSLMRASVSADEIPWRKYSENIVNIIIQPGITSTSINLFSGKDSDGKSVYKNWMRYTAADTVERISTGELAGGSALKYFNASSNATQLMHYITGSEFQIPVEKIIIPSSVKKIGDCAFNNLNKLNELVFEEGFDAIHTGTNEWSSVFRNLPALKSVTLPKSLSGLGAYTFSRLGNLTDITVLNENMVFEENCFYAIGNDVTIHGRSGSTAEEYAKKMGYRFELITEDMLLSMQSAAGEEESGSIDKIYVLIKPGEYFISEPLTFDYRDCSDIQTVYTTYGAEGKAILTGGKKIDGWEIYDSQKNIYRAYAGEGIQSRQFFVDGVRAVRARNESGEGLKNYSIDEKGILCDNEELLSYQYADDLQIMFHKAWTAPICGVESVSEEDGRVRITMENPCWTTLMTRGAENTLPDVVYYIDNAYELLDSEGEWYLNEHDGYLYYKPRRFEDLSTAETILPVTEKLIEIEGSEYLPAKNIRFENLQFAYTTWLEPSTNAGMPTKQDNLMWLGKDRYFRADAAVDVRCASNIDFIDCTFTKLGSIALKMAGGVQNCNITGNEIYDTSSNGICISDTSTGGIDKKNPLDSLKNRNILVADNFVHNTAQDYHAASSISTNYVMDTVIRNNEIFNNPYTGIHMGMVEADNYISGFSVKDNYIHDVVNGMLEGCPIYTFGPTNGTEENPNVISGNYCTYGWNRFASIGNDYDVSNIIIRKNVLDGSDGNRIVDDEYVGEYYKDYLKNWRLSDTGIGSTNMNITIEDNFGTTGANIASGVKYDAHIDNHTVCEFAENWPEEARKIIAASGLEKEYAHNYEDVVREIEIPEKITMKKGETLKIPYTAYGAKYAVYTKGNIKSYCYTGDEDIISVGENEELTAKNTGSTMVKVCFKCKDLLKWKRVSITVEE